MLYSLMSEQKGAYGSKCLRIQVQGLLPTRLLCPWGSPGKNAGVGCHALLQGIFPTQGLNPCLPCLLHWQEDSYPLCHQGSLLKLWYIYTMEYYSFVKTNTFKSILMRWMNLEPIIQSEVSQKEKDKYRVLTHVYRI